VLFSFTCYLIRLHINNAKQNLAEKKHEAVKEVCPDTPSVSQPLKAKTTKAERRALQEAQRAAKASKGYSYDSFPDLNFSAFGKTYRMTSIHDIYFRIQISIYFGLISCVFL
jgi:hypothetical protein